MDTKAVIAELENSKWRDLLESLVDADPVIDYQRYSDFYDALRAAEQVGHMQSELAPSVADCFRLIRLGMVGQFRMDDNNDRVRGAILRWFWGLRHSSFASTIAENYEDASQGARGYALVILIMQGSPDVLDTLLNIAIRYGLPDSLQPRFFSELCARHMKSASKIATTLLMHAGRWTIGGIMDFITSAIGQGELRPAMLSPAKEYSESEAQRLLTLIEPLQQTQGAAWRSYEEYRDLRNPLGVHLDLLGTIPGASLEQAHRALALTDPLLVFYALLRCCVRARSYQQKACSAAQQALKHA